MSVVHCWRLTQRAMKRAKLVYVNSSCTAAQIYNMELCSFHTMPSFISVSWTTIDSHVMRIVKDFSIRTLEKVVVNHIEYCLFSLMLELRGARVDGAAELPRNSFLCPKCLWTCPLGHSINLCCWWRLPPNWQPLQTKRRAKMYHWINLMHTVHIMNEAEACSQIKQEFYMLTSALLRNHFLTKQAELRSRAIDTGWSVLKATFPFCFVCSHSSCSIIALL